MIPELPEMVLPKWLREIVDDPQRGARCELPLQELLRDSLYYPACGLDEKPIKYLAGNVFSFVYAEYCKLQQDRMRDRTFDGYFNIVWREFGLSEFVDPGWQPAFQVPLEKREVYGWEKRTFILWSVWKRLPDKESSHGPELFSLLYMGSEAVNTYHILYNGNNRQNTTPIAPKILAIVQPGDGFGGGWTPLKKPAELFHKVVSDNPGGMPQYILCDKALVGSPEAPCWREYDERIWTSPEQADCPVVLWKVIPSYKSHGGE
jgi:hypothetical protein